MNIEMVILCLVPHILAQGVVSIYSILQTAWIITAWKTVSPIRKTQKAGMKFSMHNRTCDILNLFYFCSTAVRKPISFKAVVSYTSVFLHIFFKQVLLQISVRVLMCRGIWAFLGCYSAVTDARGCISWEWKQVLHMQHRGPQCPKVCCWKLWVTTARIHGTVSPVS